MKKIILLSFILVLLAGCTGNVQKFDTKEKEEIKFNENSENAELEIDRTGYLTGEIITDGDYQVLSGGIGGFSFVPDKESREIIMQKYGANDIYYLKDESYFLYYDDISMTEKLPAELGIYKVRVKLELKKIYNYDRFNLIDIELTDNIIYPMANYMKET